MRSAPSAAIIAPLSVHSANGGTRKSTPALWHSSSARPRTRELAATPPPMSSRGTPYSSQAASAFFHQYLRHRFLKGGGNIGHTDLGSRRASRLNVAGHRGFETRERKVVAVALLIFMAREPPWERHRVGIAFLRYPINMRPTGIGKAEHPEPPCQTLHRQHRQWFLPTVRHRRPSPSPEGATCVRLKPTGQW